VEQSVSENQIVAYEALQDDDDWFEQTREAEDQDTPGAMPVDDVVSTAGDRPGSGQASGVWYQENEDEGFWVERALGLEAEASSAEHAAERIAILLEIGSIWRDRLDERDAAASAFERVLELDPRNDEAFSALEGIYTLQGEGAKLVTLLLHGAEHSENVADRVEHMQRVAQLYEAHHQPEKALLVLEAALEAAPDNPPLAAEIQRLRQAAAILYAGDGGPPTPDPRVQQVAERAATDPIDVLQQQLDESDDDDEQADLCEQMAALWLRDRDDEDRATDCLRRALRFAPGRTSVLDELERIYVNAGTPETFAKVLDGQVHELPGGRLQRRLLERLAALYEGPLDDARRALDTYERLHALAPDESEPLDRIIRLARLLSDWERVVKALHTLTGFQRSESEQAGLHYQIGSIYHYQLGDHPSAEQQYARALEVEPAHIPSLARIGALYREDEQWSKLAHLLQRAKAYCGQSAQRAEFLHEAGSIYLTQLRDPTTAAELLERALKLDPHRIAVVELLADIYWQDGRTERLEPLLETLLRGCEDPVERVQLITKLAEVTERLGRPENALEHYRAAHDLDPQANKPLSRLADLSYEARDWATAYSAYRDLLAHESELDQAEVVRARRRLADAARQLDRTDEAIDALQAVIATDDDPQARRNLVELLQQQGKWAAAAELQEQMLVDADGQERFDLRLSLGDLYSGRLGVRTGLKSITSVRSSCVRMTVPRCTGYSIFILKRRIGSARSISAAGSPRSRRTAS
jgi:tetratricopeptide (TPR) repeat protein